MNFVAFGFQILVRKAEQVKRIYRFKYLGNLAPSNLYSICRIGLAKKTFVREEVLCKRKVGMRGCLHLLKHYTWLVSVIIWM